MTDITIKITMEHQDKPPLLGFHQEWMSGDDEDGEFKLSVGAGLGNPYLQAKIDGEYYVADIRPFFTELIEKAREGT